MVRATNSGDAVIGRRGGTVAQASGVRLEQRFHHIEHGQCWRRDRRSARPLLPGPIVVQHVALQRLNQRELDRVRRIHEVRQETNLDLDGYS